MSSLKQSPVNHQGIETVITDLSSQGKCPYHKVVNKLNQFSKYAGSDRLPAITKVISDLIVKIFHEKKIPSHSMISGLGEGMSEVSSAKLYKHLYDVVYLQEELFPIIHSLLIDNIEKSFLPLEEDSIILDFKDSEQRKQWWSKFGAYFVVITQNIINKWEKSKSGDEIFNKAEDYAHHYSMLNTNSEYGLAETFINGIGDGLGNMRAIVSQIPVLFETKYQRLPSRWEYRRIVEENLKQIIIPVASINMLNLTHVVRPKEKDNGFKFAIDEKTNEVQYVILTDAKNAMDIDTESFELGDNDQIIVTNSYLKERIERLKHQENIAMRAISSKDKSYKHGIPVTTGCPALIARTPEGKRVIEQLCEDYLAILDKIYFPYRDK